MIRRRATSASPSLVLLLAACATPPTPLPDAALLVSAAEEQVRNSQWQAALATLEPLADDGCPKRLRDRRDLAKARAQLGSGRPWDAYETLRDFSDNYPYSDRRGEVAQVLWLAGKTLAESDGGFLFLWSDRDAGRTVLEHLITRHPDTQRLADALRLLGDMAFADGNYELAQERYRSIILDRPDSDWRFYAQFRFAMSIVADLQGPDYDLARMELAVSELESFLATKPENPELIAEAERAIARIRAWQVERHLRVAAFYRTLGSVVGERYHLQLATREEFRTAPLYDRALELRTRLDEQAAADGGRP